LWCVLVHALFTLVFRGAFIQYFLPLSWLLAMFASVACVSLIFPDHLSLRAVKRRVFVCGLLWCGVAIIHARGNLVRASITSDATIRQYTRMWRVIPEDAPTFPNLLFRPLAYPLPFGAFIGDVHPTVMARLGSVADALERKQIRYLILSDFAKIYVDAKTKTYIDTHYQQTGQDDISVWKEK